ncbi:hypothetical protein ASPACDRAFT_51941 [Aspergillus aculeatus ATCC 16872]|uniref:Glycosyl transferase CAP10 domain-containing protein n=1 Tax=Aspergillus aculeatus (strain ATCC 16872 / CBS 172.66 / WB 5094) TaxID=690307 RepID=A0A1L9WV70_ASPA1|nr:uncharacterized protein ASPACDRAFT_51941 [Aspergillus aculeatus ATCC 16872]OJK00121.1 hypothetical protein ASPACDRAFT_51941 [Aspergillus aculeatus ATCC 16872]
MALLQSHRWRLRQSHLLHTIYLMGLFSVIGIVLIWYGVNSDREYIHPLLTQLIPAGHCACLTSTTFQCASCLNCAHKKPLPQTALPAVLAWKFEAGRDGGNEGFSRAQCMAAFPGLFEDILRAGTFWRKHGGLDVEHLEYIPLKHGMARAFIHRGELYVVNALSRGEDHRRKILAVLSAIHRALITNPARASQQDLEFVFSVEDKVTDVTTEDQPIWAFARSAGEEAVWLMPDSGYWAWENVQNSIGPYDQKKRQLVWRRKPSFAPKLRRALMDAARGQPWGNVKHVDWNQRTNVMSLEDHCRYMFIAHVEGRSYSASLKYRQACNSVVVAHKLQYIQHHHYLLISEGPSQNYIEVDRSFNDLAAKLEPLLDDPSRAERIASNSVQTFRDRYLTKAAEACYWRMLFEGYSDVWNSSVPGQSKYQEQQRGFRYESFILLDSRMMFEFDATSATSAMG